MPCHHTGYDTHDTIIHGAWYLIAVLLQQQGKKLVKGRVQTRPPRCIPAYHCICDGIVGILPGICLFKHTWALRVEWGERDNVFPPRPPAVLRPGRPHPFDRAFIASIETHSLAFFEPRQQQTTVPTSGTRTTSTKISDASVARATELPVHNDECMISSRVYTACCCRLYIHQGSGTQPQASHRNKKKLTQTSRIFGASPLAE